MTALAHIRMVGPGVARADRRGSRTLHGLVRQALVRGFDPIHWVRAYVSLESCGRAILVDAIEVEAGPLAGTMLEPLAAWDRASGAGDGPAARALSRAGQGALVAQVAGEELRFVCPGRRSWAAIVGLGADGVLAVRLFRGPAPGAPAPGAPAPGALAPDAPALPLEEAERMLLRMLQRARVVPPIAARLATLFDRWPSLPG